MRRYVRILFMWELPSQGRCSPEILSLQLVLALFSTRGSGIPSAYLLPETRPKLILRTLGLRKGGIEVVSCPTCGRTTIDLIGLANQVENMVADIPLDLKVAVMGCVVNGPGEAREADIGIAGGIGEGLLIKKGQAVKKVKEEELLDTLRWELMHWND